MIPCWPAKSKGNKFHAVKINYDGTTFDSQREAEYYLMLRTMLRAGEITKINFQPKFVLQPKFRKCCGRLFTQEADPAFKKGICPHCGKKMQIQHEISYRADFLVEYPDGTKEIVDVKGMIPREFPRIRKMFEYQYPALHLKVVRWKNKKLGWVEI